MSNYFFQQGQTNTSILLSFSKLMTTPHQNIWLSQSTSRQLLLFDPTDTDNLVKANNNVNCFSPALAAPQNGKSQVLTQQDIHSCMGDKPKHQSISSSRP